METPVSFSYKPLLLKDSNVDFHEPYDNEVTLDAKINDKCSYSGNGFFRPTLHKIQRATKCNKYFRHADTELIKSPKRKSINRYTRSVTLNERRFRKILY